MLLQVLENLTPHTSLDYSKVRLGSDYDGGYILFDDFSNIKLAISGGLGDNDAWECEIVNKGIPTIAFDHTIVPRKNIPYNFYASPLDSFKSKNSTLDLALHSYKDNEVIAKIDIEGSEWELLRNTSLETLTKVRQLVVEFHLWDGIDTLNASLDVFEKLSNIFKVIHVHGNNYSKNILNIKGMIIPSVFELTFANIAYYNLIESNEIFPTLIDMPNNENSLDIELGTFTLRKK